MTDRKLESLTLDALIGRFREIEDENARMRPVVDAALALLSIANDSAWTQIYLGVPSVQLRRHSDAYAVLLAEARKLAGEQSGVSGELGKV